MRGNEVVIRWMRIASFGRFLIPMRGNETDLTSEQLDRYDIPNPHEG